MTNLFDTDYALPLADWERELLYSGAAEITTAPDWEIDTLASKRPDSKRTPQSKGIAIQRRTTRRQYAANGGRF